MNKIDFKDLPDTTTPINASNLNALQDNVENAIPSSTATTSADGLMSSTDKTKLDGLTNTTWNTATLASSFKAYNNNSLYMPKYRKIGNIVEIYGIVAPTSAIASAGTAVIFKLPEGYRPEGSTRWSVQQGSGTNKWVLSVYTDGDVIFQRYGTTTQIETPTSAWLPFDFTFII